MGMNFDPMTGEPITDETVKEVTETTEEVVETTQEVTANVTDTVVPTVEQPTVYSSVPEDVVAATPFYKSKAFIGGVACVAAVVVVGGVAMAALGGGTNKKILKAGANTFKANATLENLGQAGFIAKGDYNMHLEGEIEDIEFNADYNRNRGKKLMSLDANVEYDGVETAVQAYMNDKVVQLSVPLLSDEVFSYNYVDEKDGYVVDMVEDEGMEIEDIDKLFASVNEDISDKQTKLTVDVTKITNEHFKQLKFEKVKAEQFEVNGKKQKCKGYQTVLDEDTLTDWLEDYKDAFVSYYSELGEEVSLFEDYADSYEDSFDDVIDSLEDMDDLNVTFFLYKNQYAAIRMDDDDDTSIEIDFKGGDYPMQNMAMVVEADDDDIEIELTTEVKKDDITKVISYEGKDVVTIEYNKKSGEYNLEANVDGDKLEMGGTYLSKSDSISLTIDKLEAEDEDIDINFSMTVSKGSKVMDQLADEDDVFDVGNADEDDWNDLAEDLYETIYDNDELRGLMYYMF
ncbi:MAG: hypothetical protein II798_04345 [Lachnospiraceae bacterium]|nr:hypothetical protein [Lachnospiraceae bacterium]